MELQQKSIRMNNSIKQRTRRLFVARLPFETSSQDILEYFIRFGEITDVYCPKDPATPQCNKGFGFVSYRNVTSSQQAFNSGPHIIRGREIVIDYALERPTEEILNGTSQDSTIHSKSSRHNYSKTSSEINTIYINNNIGTFSDENATTYIPNISQNNYEDPDRFNTQESELDCNEQKYSCTIPLPSPQYNSNTTPQELDTLSNNSFNNSFNTNNYVTPIPTQVQHITKSKIPFQMHIANIEKDSFSTIMKFFDFNEPQLQDFTSLSAPSDISPCSNPINFINPNQLNSSIHLDSSAHLNPYCDPQKITKSLEVHSSLISSSSDDKQPLNLFAKSLEFNINIPQTLINEISEKNNNNQLIKCHFNFYLEPKKNSQPVLSSASGNISKHKQTVKSLSRIQSSCTDSIIELSTSPNTKSGSNSLNNLTFPSTTTPNLTNHNRNTKRPPGGNEWIKRGHRIYVGQLGATISSDDLKFYFQKFGEVVDAYIPKDFSNGTSRGFGFVTFLEPYVAEELISSAPKRTDKIRGSRITISKARPS